MDNFITGTKLFIAAVGAFLTAKLGILFPVLGFLVVAMVIDYISGMMASAKEGGLSSKKGLQGILKKFGYAFVISVAMILDWLILSVAGEIGLIVPTTTFCGLLVAIWFILNEILSIIENAGRFGVPIPPFLKKAIAAIKEKVEEIGDKQAEIPGVKIEIKEDKIDGQ